MMKKSIRNLLLSLKRRYWLLKIALKCKRLKKPCLISVSYYDYFHILTQRPQHIFNKLSRQGQPIVCCTISDKYTQVNDNLFVIPYRKLPHFMHARGFDKVFMIPYNYPCYEENHIRLFDALKDDSLVLYEFMDDFDLLASPHFPNWVEQATQTFVKLIQRDRTFVLTSANRLHDMAVELGADPAKVFISKNAVNIEDFAIKRMPSPEMKAILARGKPVIGYYGAIADWFDFDLLKTVVQKNPQWEFVVIGPENDDLKPLMELDNFTHIPSIPYAEIPAFAQNWDVATIPFKINNVTLGTSPVKMFEYMAMGLPIVTTPMPECMLYDSVFIARDAAEFEQKIRDALAAKDDAAYQQTLAAEAAANTWDARVDDIVQIIDKNYKK